MNLLVRYRRWRTNADYWDQSRATESLDNAWMYLWKDFWSRASNKERGKLLPEQQEAIDLIHKLARESLDRMCELI